VNKRFLGQFVVLLPGLLIAAVVPACAQDQRGDWAMTGADAGQNGWQKDEQGLSPDTIAGKFKYLWKIKLGQAAKGGESFSEPIMIGRVINGQGFKDIVFMSSRDTLYAVDSELGSIIWKKQYSFGREAAGCDASRLSILMEPPVVINFNARRKRPPGTPRPPDPPPAKSTERKLGVAPGGGYFGFKGVYVITPDGMLHEQVVTTGTDFAPPVKFLTGATGSVSGLNFVDKTIYAATTSQCGDVPTGLWSINLASGDYAVSNYKAGSSHVLSLAGPVVTQESTSILVTGPGSSDGDAHPGSVIALDKELKVHDWYSPEGGFANYEHVSPIILALDKKQVVVAPGKDGTIALLDLSSLGGADHHTPLLETGAIAKTGEKHSWDGFAVWSEKDGTTYLFASISAPIALSDSSVKSSGSNPHGGIVAFKVSDVDGKVSLKPVWVSDDMVNPAPPRVANGVVVALAGGDSQTNAVLHVINATTGAELYASKSEISTYSHLSGVSVGDSHAFFTDHDDVLYSFGLALEH
jgi:hypothetical protein